MLLFDINTLATGRHKRGPNSSFSSTVVKNRTATQTQKVWCGVQHKPLKQFID